MSTVPMQYITDTSGKPLAVVLPIDFWRKMFPQDETDKILSSKKMRERILSAMQVVGHEE